MNNPYVLIELLVAGLVLTFWLALYLPIVFSTRIYPVFSKLMKRIRR